MFGGATFLEKGSDGIRPHFSGMGHRLNVWIQCKHCAEQTSQVFAISGCDTGAASTSVKVGAAASAGFVRLGNASVFASTPFSGSGVQVLHRRSQKLVCLSLQRIEELVPLLGSDLVVQACPQLSDVQKDWCLVGIGSHGCSDFTTAQRLLQQPAVRNGKLWLRFRAWGPTASLDELAVVSLKILKARLIGQTFNLLQPRPIAGGAADAWADATVAGLGGWFCDRNGELRWFHLQLVATDFPADWEWPQTMQSGISALELLAQQVLVQLQGCGWFCISFQITWELWVL